jgi:alanine racemase
MTTWAEIDLTRLHANLDLIVAAAQTPAMPVVKANAYGHGAVRVAKEIARRGDVAALCVWTLEEGAELRRAGVKKRIVLLGGVPPGRAREGVALNVEPVVGADDRLAELAQAAGKNSTPVHVKYDTGMNRLGGDGDRVEELYRAVATNPRLRPVGLMTHFVDAEEKRGIAQRQMALFDALCRTLEKSGFTLPPRHAANTAGIFLHPAARYETVRPGIGLYGVQPFVGAPVGLSPTMSLYGMVSFVRHIAKGESVSYGRTWTAPSKKRVAAVWGGYADGYPRLLSNKAFAIMNGVKAPQIGTVCMDVALFDVSRCGAVSPGDVMTLMGESGEGGPAITAARLARLMGTIPYEVLCGVGRRVPRVYKKQGRLVGVARLMDATA